MLYAVPQTDSPGEAAMAALVARLRATSPKPDALALVSDTTIALHLTKAIGAITSALGDRLGDGVGLIQWDGALDGVCIDLANRRVYNTRGRNRQAGADSSIDAVADDAEAYLARLRPGGDANGKTETPIYVAGAADIGDRARFTTSPRADSWVHRQRLRRGF